MDNIGSFLRELRIQNNMSIEQLSEITKVKTYIIDSIENNRFDNIENLGVAKIFINTLAKTLKVSSTQINTMLATLDKKYENKKVENIAIATHVTPRKLVISSNFFYALFLLVVLVAFTWIIIYFYDQGKLSFNELKKELFVKEKKEKKAEADNKNVSSTDSIWVKQSQVLDAKKPVEKQTDNLINNVKAIYDTTDYVSELIFENKKNALNPEI